MSKALFNDIQVNLVLAFNDKTICVTYYRWIRCWSDLGHEEHYLNLTTKSLFHQFITHIVAQD